MEIYDLKTKEGFEKFNEAVDEIEDFFGPSTLFKESFKELKDLGSLLHNSYNKETKKEEKKQPKIINPVKEAVKQMDNKEDENPKSKFIRPSESLSVNQKLQLHNIVQEYVDTCIKPFNNGVLSDKQINDAYAGLYEFGAWIMNR